MNEAQQWQLLLDSRRLEDTGKVMELRDSRSDFERDYDRIVFSTPFRHLQDKTQVFPFPENDFVHSRLTHSLEVSSVGRSLGRASGMILADRHSGHGIDPFEWGAVVASACLAHDIGNPPFGHSGEAAISEFFIQHPELMRDMQTAEVADLCNFEGNAQGFRLLTHSQGEKMKLTRAMLLTFTKYPCTSVEADRSLGLASRKKFGYFQSEKEQFEALVNPELAIFQGQQYKRHPLTFLMEAADDICYHIIDFEDGCRLGLIPEQWLVDLFAGILGDDFKAEKLRKIDLLHQRIAVLRAMVINQLIQSTVEIFVDHEQALLKGEFDQSILNESPYRSSLDEIIELSVKHIYRSREVVEIEAAGFEIIGGLLELFITAIEDRRLNQREGAKSKAVLRLLPDFNEALLEDNNPYELYLQVTDFISGLSDSKALSLFRKVKGISIPGKIR